LNEKVEIVEMAATCATWQVHLNPRMSFGEALEALLEQRTAFMKALNPPGDREEREEGDPQKSSLGVQDNEVGVAATAATITTTATSTTSTTSTV